MLAQSFPIFFRRKKYAVSNKSVQAVFLKSTEFQIVVPTGCNFDAI